MVVVGLSLPPRLASSKLGSHCWAVITNWTRSLIYSSSSLQRKGRRHIRPCQVFPQFPRSPSGCSNQNKGLHVPFLKSWGNSGEKEVIGS